ncbi:hypothetical protein WN944_029031 [Citrus x changshan-huyou]|uniref:Uncharacterized protein n=1 Tax=Citrus x changshan-huyou TaxID=2935761 RepID=A0AAP0LN41_9ROSI
MNLKAFFVLSAVLSLLLLFANRTEARKDQGEYWRGFVKDSDVPESIQIHVRQDPVSTASNAKAHCKEPEDLEHKREKTYVKDSEATIDILVYHNSIKPTEQKLFANHFESSADATIYHNDIKPTEQKLFANHFESSPHATIYHNDIKPSEQKLFGNHFESSPDASIYHNDIKPIEMIKSFVSKFLSNPDATIYHE